MIWPVKRGRLIVVEIRISGRGGQGAVLASQILAECFFKNGLFVQTFPSFGAERRGAPVSAFLRVDSNQITLRCGVQRPDWIMVFDPNLLENPTVMSGTIGKTWILVNSPTFPEPLKAGRYGRIFLVEATAIALQLKLEATSVPIVNTAMVGAFAKASGLVDLNTIAQAVRNAVPVKKEENVAAAAKGYEKVQEVL